MTESHLVIQRDATMLVTPGEGRRMIIDALRCCAQLHKIVAGSYLYRLSPVAMWGAAARGVSCHELLEGLARMSGQSLPPVLVKRILEPFSRYGALRLEADGGGLVVRFNDPTILDRIDGEWNAGAARGWLALLPSQVGAFKLEAARSGWPVVDSRPRATGTTSTHSLTDAVRLRPYQREALASFHSVRDGVVLLPCGSGKTVVGIAAALDSELPALVLTPSRSVAEQWVSAFRRLTTLSPGDVGLLEGDGVLRLVTVATYQAATMGNRAGEVLDHPWGLVIFDEVQSLPADTFRLAASFTASRRLGLTATLVREDGRELEIAALVGPVVYDAPWSELEAEGWIAPARCVEIRIPESGDPSEHGRYKLAVVERLLSLHHDEQVIVIATDLSLIRRVARRFGIQLLTGATGAQARASALDAFRQGTIRRIAMSKIGSTGLDLPNASVLIQVNGTFGSRQEEAQRLGRLLRPGPGKSATFYTLTIDAARDIRFAERRQRFLVDQGYQYEVRSAASLPRVTT